ncbi:MAG: nucleotidyltransferase domain-containing protein, partial [Pseudomonadota bacterium]
MTQVSLAHQLHDIASTEGSAAELGAVLRRSWEGQKEKLISSTIDGGAISEGLSQHMDYMVGALASVLLDDEITVVATGGYGRGRLAPYSDIDLLFLLEGEDQEARLAPFLYALWDGGLPLSQATHTVQSAIKAASDDTVIRTAFLDARFLSGNEEAYTDFQNRFDRLRRQTLTGFIEAKLQERDDRHDRLDGSRYAIEPDIKEGKGGLRDLDTLHWIDRYVSGLEDDPSPAIDTPGLFTPKEMRRIQKLFDFFWSVRIQLHEVAGRADENLNFGVQPLIAERLGYSPRGEQSAVERFMQHYFLNAKEVGRLTGSACALLEEKALKQSPPLWDVSRVFSLFQSSTGEEKVDGEPNLVFRSGRLNFVDHEQAKGNIRDLFVLFRAAGRHQFSLHPDAFKTATRGARRLTPNSVNDADIAKIFRQILTESIKVESILRYMTECGLLGRYITSYGAIIGKVEYGLFRRFTLDEHVLRSVGVLSDILHDRDDGRFV